MRADQLLVTRGLASTRSQAQRLIASGVDWLGPRGWQLVAKNGEELDHAVELQLRDTAERRYVSRGGLKLEGALDQCGIAVSARICLDVGQSTGGFTDVLLQRGAARVVGVDVGHGQLHPSLAANSQVRCLEGVNARDLSASVLGDAMPPEGFGVLVADLSFISLTKVLAPWRALLAAEADVIALVKPQFEVGRAGIGKGGLVKNESSYPVVEQSVRDAFIAAGFTVHGYFGSAISGGDGNREFFVWARPSF